MLAATPAARASSTPDYSDAEVAPVEPTQSPSATRSTELLPDRGETSSADDGSTTQDTRSIPWVPIGSGVLGVGVLALLLVACGDDAADTCASAADCAEGEICVNGDCVPVVGDSGGVDAGRGDDAGEPPDAAPRDTGEGDTGAPVDGGPDTGPADTGPDTGPADTGPRDTGPRDTGGLDTGPPPTLPQLVGHYRCEAFVRGGMVDDSGRANTARCEPGCPSLVADRRPGGGLVCDFGVSTTARLRVTFDPVDHQIEDGFTVATWARFPSERQGSLVGLPVGDDIANVWQIFASRAPEFEVSFVTHDGTMSHGLRRLVSLDTWHHIAITYDGRRKRLYVGGSLVASEDVPTTSPDGQDIFIGADQNAGAIALPFDGELDEIRIYRGVLSGPEIAELTLE